MGMSGTAPPRRSGSAVGLVRGVRRARARPSRGGKLKEHGSHVTVDDATVLLPLLWGGVAGGEPG